MCGYIGLFGGNLKTEKIRYELKKALNAFKYRGPDESFVNEISSCIIGFNRLSINHLHKGKQPIVFRNSGSFRKILICFNGEIFNHKSLEKDFLKGPFNRDEITILAELFSKFGLEFVKLLNGQFSISIVDSNTNPNKVTYPIPANDDSMRTINIIISALADAVMEAKGISQDNGNPEDTVSSNSKEIKDISEDNYQEEE